MTPPRAREGGRRGRGDLVRTRPWSILLALLVGCDEAPTYLRTYGPSGDPLTSLGWYLVITALLVVLVVSALLVWALARRRGDTDGPVAAHGPQASEHRGRELAWIYWGVGVSIVILVGSNIFSMATMAAAREPASPPAVVATVIGHRWWWEVRYQGPDSARIVTANELHIPVGQVARVELRTDDVIHSFWVPQLAGKMDLIPGQSNAIWLQADEPGVYLGACAEFCGVQHANMAFRVVAESPSEFQAWLERQSQPVPSPTTADLARGQEIFRNVGCGACHTLRGGGASGTLGPDLTHVGGRLTLAAGLLPNNLGHLAGWIANPQQIKPGSLMPDLDLAPDQLRSVAAYLETLQ